MNLEFYADQYLKEANEKNEKKLMEEIVRLILADENIIIDGIKNEDGSVDPSYIQVDTDNRFYFHVYTSKKRFDESGGKQAFVLSLKSLFEPIFNDDSFGGISLNYKKGQEVVLISKENTYNYMALYLKNMK